MKKTVFFGLLVIVLAFGLIGCGPDDDYTVTFDLDGGNIGGNPDSIEITVKSGETIANLPAPQKANNTFGGWFTARNGLGNPFTTSTVVTSNVTVFAKWTATSGGNGGKTFTINGIGISGNVSVFVILDTLEAIAWGTLSNVTVGNNVTFSLKGISGTEFLETDWNGSGIYTVAVYNMTPAQVVTAQEAPLLSFQSVNLTGTSVAVSWGNN